MCTACILVSVYLFGRNNPKSIGKVCYIILLLIKHCAKGSAQVKQKSALSAYTTHALFSRSHCHDREWLLTEYTELGDHTNTCILVTHPGGNKRTKTFHMARTHRLHTMKYYSIISSVHIYSGKDISDQVTSHQLAWRGINKRSKHIEHITW